VLVSKTGKILPADPGYTGCSPEALSAVFSCGKMVPTGSPLHATMKCGTVCLRPRVNTKFTWRDILFRYWMLGLWKFRQLGKQYTLKMFIIPWGVPVVSIVKAWLHGSGLISVLRY